MNTSYHVSQLSIENEYAEYGRSLVTQLYSNWFWTCYKPREKIKQNYNLGVRIPLDDVSVPVAMVTHA